jgi:hypothetical protein
LPWCASRTQATFALLERPANIERCRPIPRPWVLGNDVHTGRIATGTLAAGSPTVSSGPPLGQGGVPLLVAFTRYYRNR